MLGWGGKREEKGWNWAANIADVWLGDLEFLSAVSSSQNEHCLIFEGGNIHSLACTSSVNHYVLEFEMPPDC